MTVCVVIPVHARVPALVDLTYRTLETLRSAEDLSVICMINRLDPVTVEEFTLQAQRRLPAGTPLLVNADKERCVASTWNAAMRLGTDGDPEFFLIANNDIDLRPDTIDTLVQFGREAPSNVVLWSAVNVRDHDTPDTLVTDGADFSCFMVYPNFLFTVGPFDENYSPCYWEDTDITARIVLSGRRALTVHAAKYFHTGSATIKLDPHAAAVNRATFVKNQAYFQRKWGVSEAGRTPEEIRNTYFRSPFNSPGAALSWWPQPTREEFL